jgi:beta-1,4-N-acetylglucosaminyltransferase
MKICLAASSGGHLTELLKVTEACNGRTYFFVIPDPSLVKPMLNETEIYVVIKANRENPILIIKMLGQCIRIMVKERPDVVISTGAAVGCILCVLAKLMRKKVIWIDTISHVNRLTMSGRIIKPMADLFLVQWPHLVDKYKGVRYVGAII